MDARSQPMDDKLLFARIADGDEAAFRQLFAQYTPVVYPLIVQVTKSGPVAEDILQETFLRLWVHRDKLKEIRNPRAWILRIAYFRSFTYLRDQSIHIKAITALSAVETNPADAELLMAFKSTETLIRKAVDQLPRQQKQVYRLSRESGLKTGDIAREMGLSEQSVKNTLVRALKFIRDYLEKAGYALLVLFLLIDRY